jgi:hypothetical protein
MTMKQVFSWKKNSGHESQGAYHQDKLIGSELPVMK